MAKRRKTSKPAAKRAMPAKRKAVAKRPSAKPQSAARRTAAGKKTAAKRKAAARRPAPRRTTGTAGRPPAPAASSLAGGDRLDLRALRRDVERALAVLAGRGDVSPKLASTQEVMSRWVGEIDGICEPAAEEICGPTMVIPLA